MTPFLETRSARILRVGFAALAGLCLAMSQALAQQSFKSPDEAAAALAAAVKSGAKQDMLGGRKALAGVSRGRPAVRHSRNAAHGCQGKARSNPLPWHA